MHLEAGLKIVYQILKKDLADFEKYIAAILKLVCPRKRDNSKWQRPNDYVNLTIVMKQTKQGISKSRFKSRALEYFRQVQKSRKPLIITDRGKPVLKVVPYSEDPEEILKELRNSVVKYKDPTKPVGESDWEVLG